MARHTESVVLKKVYIEEDGRLPVVPSHVDQLAASIKEIGLLEPIIVCRRTKRTPTLILVAGRHRLEACKKLRHSTISAVVESEDSPEIERWRALAEIDENLIRRDITTVQRARLVAKRKKAYEEVHPETKHGGAPGKKNGAGGKQKSKDPNSRSFVKDTVSKTGRSKASIEQDQTRAKKLGHDLDRLDGTSLDKGVELDALANMPADERKPLIDRAVAGEKVSARAKKLPERSGDLEMPTEEEADQSWQNDIYDQACLLLSRMADETRAKFIAQVDADDPAIKIIASLKSENRALKKELSAEKRENAALRHDLETAYKAQGHLMERLSVAEQAADQIAEQPA